MIWDVVRRVGLLLMLFLCANLRGQEPDLQIPDTPEVLSIAPGPSDRFPESWYPRRGDGTEVFPAPVLDRPFVGVEQSVTMIPTQDGKASRYVTRNLRARDRFGRTRSESIDGGVTINGKSVETQSIVVGDPVSHCQFHWMHLMMAAEAPPEYRVAFVTCGPQTLRYKEMDVFSMLMGSPAGAVTRGETTTTIEKPAPLLIDGLTVERVRVTNTRTDKDGKPSSQVTETWYSPELKELIRMGAENNDDPTGLVDIQRKDPDPKLFYPPDGYRIEVQAAH